MKTVIDEWRSRIIGSAVLIYSRPCESRTFFCGRHHTGNIMLRFGRSSLVNSNHSSRMRRFRKSLRFPRNPLRSFCVTSRFVSASIVLGRCRKGKGATWTVAFKCSNSHCYTHCVSHSSSSIDRPIRTNWCAVCCKLPNNSQRSATNTLTQLHGPFEGARRKQHDGKGRARASSWLANDE